MTIEEAMRQVIEEKQILLQDKIKPQLDDRLQRKTITPITAQKYQLALDNFDKSLIELTKGTDYHEAVYFFSRGCVNLGELTGRADKEKKSA